MQADAKPAARRLTVAPGRAGRSQVYHSHSRACRVTMGFSRANARLSRDHSWISCGRTSRPGVETRQTDEPTIFHEEGRVSFPDRSEAIMDAIWEVWHCLNRMLTQELGPGDADFPGKRWNATTSESNTDNDSTFVSSRHHFSVLRSRILSVLPYSIRVHCERNIRRKRVACRYEMG